MERYNKGLILAKIESVYGTDPTPAVATNALITMGMPTFEIVGNALQRNIPLGHFGSVKPVNVGEALKLNFTTELKGSGSAGTASRYGCLLRACNLTEAVDPGVNVTYTPNSTFEGESVTLWFYANTTLHKITGAVGNAVLKFVSNEIAVIEWSFTGLYAGSGHASTVTFPSPTHEAIAPVVWRGASFELNGGSVVINEISIDLGNEVAKRLDGNATYGISRYFVKNRAVKGSMIIEKEALSSYNPFSIWDAATQHNVTFNSGASAGNICGVAVTGVMIEQPKYADKENIQMYDLAFTVNPTVATGNNEIVLTFT